VSSGPYIRPYFDSGLFISWLHPAGDVGTLADGSSGDRHPISTAVLQDAEDGKYGCLTSYFTMAEVFKKKGHGVQALTSDQNGKILKYFDNPWITWVEVDYLVGRMANELLVKYHGSDRLQPCDAIHLAAALRAKCDVLLTWDTRLAAISHPDIRIELPSIYMPPPPPPPLPTLFDGFDDGKA
jgi:predicted nucleic acid-binding protein